MSYPAITLYELATTRYTDLLREASEQRIRHTPAARIGRKSSWLPGIFAAIAAFRTT